HSDGARCTPTVVGGLVYAVGTDGDLVCVDASTGREVWRTNLEKNLGGRMMSGWRFSESPLVDGDKVIVTPGSAQSTMVALNRRTGKLIWRCAAGDIGQNGADGAGYSSAVVAQVGDVRMYVQQYGRGLIGVDAATGKLRWSYNRVACGTANIMTPIVKDRLVFVSNAYQAGAACVRMVPESSAVRAEEVYFLPPRTFQNHHGGAVLVGDYVYGGHGQNAGAPTCIELKTGKVMWQASAPGRGSAAVLYADGKLYFRYENGTMALIEASPAAYGWLARSTSRLRPGLPGRTRWCSTVVCTFATTMSCCATTSAAGASA
ncbi:MAG: PQQ-binding-like beta-propeller repeat protein, partial [Chthonomonadales bacterium]|nr:PQQ-binding-like beta-propeller repeat protein [Chthonomonadales bacterium]